MITSHIGITTNWSYLLVYYLRSQTWTTEDYRCFRLHDVMVEARMLLGKLDQESYQLIVAVFRRISGMISPHHSSFPPDCPPCVLLLLAFTGKLRVASCFVDSFGDMLASSSLNLIELDGCVSCTVDIC